MKKELKHNRTTQSDLGRVYELQRQIKESANHLKNLKRELRHMTYKLSWEIEKHWPVESGAFSVELEEKSRKVIDWKQELVKLLTEGTAKEIENETCPRIYKHLKVTRRS